MGNGLFDIGFVVAESRAVDDFKAKDLLVGRYFQINAGEG